MFEDFVNSLHQLVERKLSDVNTNTPGVIVSYSAETNRAVVKVSIPKRLADDEPLEGPPIVDVPVVWPSSGGGKSSFTMPLQPGDGVMLAFQQRSLENWLDGDMRFPDDPRQHDLSDCVAIAGCSPGGIVGHSENVVLKFDKTSISLSPKNEMSMGSDKGSISLDADGNIKHTTPNMSVSDKLTLAHDPGASMEAATKQYNDSTNTFMRDEMEFQLDELRAIINQLDDRLRKLERKDGI